MDISTLTKIVISKIKEVIIYSEITDEQLYKTIYKSLNTTYQKHFYQAQKRIKDDENRGVFITRDKYKKEYDGVENIVMAHANKLAATNKTEV